MEEAECIQPQYNIRRLEKQEIVKSFDCGDADLNNFILNKSLLYRKELLAVSYAVEDNSKSVIAYFSLANDRVSLSDFEDKTAFNRFRRHRFVNEKRLKSYPAVKICRFGVDLMVKKHIGTRVLNFIKSYFIEDNKTGCRFITVDAYSSAIPFDLKNGFEPLTSDDENDATRLLYFDLNDIVD
ncbi:GNAT family N-acetyltransferase [Bacteroides intestinalis]|uniref:GNAT family N-acetyltransferase n=1 Tax=Bacteroides intestinalis TaxID=329854 RepID=A0A414LAK3_9BACE|nr:GNAT family N-acetyltransferase [Bacteroides intestinalis]RHE91594.1 GNAT family N-acetyltransferase [Bacteroides intestinalis]